MYVVDGNYLHIFSSQQDAATMLGVPRNTLGNKMSRVPNGVVECKGKMVYTEYPTQEAVEEKPKYTKKPVMRSGGPLLGKGYVTHGL